MARRIRALVPLGGAALAALAVLGSAAAAPAGVVTYVSTDVPKSVDDSQIVSSRLTIPGDRPPVTDLDVIGVQVSAPGGMHNDKVLELFSPRVPDGIATLIPGCPSLGLNITYDDQAPAAFAVPADCAATATRRPFGGTLRSLLHEDPDSGKLDAAGNWSLQFRDNGGPAFTGPPATLSAWGLRITYLPMTFSASAKKQPLRKKLVIAASCSGGCDVKTAGKAKPRTIHLDATADSLRVPLKKKVARRLEDGGKAKIALVASNDLGDVVSQTVRVKVTG